MGALVDTKDGRGQSALHGAAARGHLQTVRTLLSLGSSDDARDSRGRSALDAAARAGHTEVAAVLLGHRVSSRGTGTRDTGLLRSALAAANRHGRNETFQLLYHYGAGDCGIVAGIVPLTQQLLSFRSDAVVTGAEDAVMGVTNIANIVDGERNLINRLS
jgi:hypothetical protein